MATGERAQIGNLKTSIAGCLRGKLTRLVGIAFLLSKPPQVAAQPFAYVSHAINNYVEVIDTATGRHTASIYVPLDPGEIAITPDGCIAYVVSWGWETSTVSILDLTDNTVAGAIELPGGQGARAIALTPDAGHAYVTNAYYSTITVIDTAANAVEGLLHVGSSNAGTGHPAMAPNGHFAYVPNYWANTITVLNTDDNSLAATIDLGQINDPRYLSPYGVAITPDGNVAYVAVAGGVAVIDTTTNSVGTLITFDNPDFGGVAIGPDGTSVYATQFSSGEFTGVRVIDAARNELTAAIPVAQPENRPLAIAVGATDQHLYVISDVLNTSNILSIIDPATNTVTGMITLGEFASGLAIAPRRGVCTPPNTPLPTGTPTPIATFTPTSTRTATPTRGVEVDVSSAAGNPGDEVTVEVTLSTAGHAVAAIQNDLTASGSVRFLTCTVNAGIHKDLTAFAYSLSGLRAIVFGDNTGLLPDGVVLYTCRLRIPPGTLPFTYPLFTSHVVAAAPDGTTVPAIGTDGVVQVLGPPTRTPTQTWTPSTTGTVTPTPTPLPPSIDLGRTFGSPGARITIEATLALRGTTVAALRNDITFTPNARIAARPDGGPACTINPAIGEQGAFAFLPSGCRGIDCTSVRVLVSSIGTVDPIPDGTVVYSCNVDLAPDIAAGTFPLLVSNVVLSTPNGDDIPGAFGTNGSVSVGIPTPVVAGPGIAILADSAHPGAPMLVSVLLYTNGMSVWGVSSSIRLNNDAAPIDVKPDGTPDCTLGPDSATVGTVQFAPYGCVGTQCTAVWVQVSLDSSAGSPAEGALLYTCRFNVSPAAKGSVPLAISASIDTAPPGSYGAGGFINATADADILVQPSSPPQVRGSDGGCAMSPRSSTAASGTLQLLLAAGLLAGCAWARDGFR